MSKGSSHLFLGTSGAGQALIDEVVVFGEGIPSENTNGYIVGANPKCCNGVKAKIKIIRLRLEYNTYCLWLYDENGLLIDNANPPEWRDDWELTDAFMAVSNLYDTFFLNNENGFSYIGCPDEETACKLRELFSKALDILMKKNRGKYIIRNDVDLNNL